MMNVFRFALHLIQSIIRHNLGYIAAVIAYFGFSSMIPLAILIIYGASLFIPGGVIERFLDSLLQSALPSFPSGLALVKNTVHHLTTLGPGLRLIGIVGFFWGAVGGFVTLQLTLDIIGDTKKRRSFVKQYVVGFLTLGFLMALTLVSSMTISLAPMLVHTFLGASPTGWLWTLGTHIATRIFFSLIIFVTCYFCYRVLPSKQLANSALWIGAAIATVTIYVSREGFAIYTHHLGNYHLIYGTLTFIMLFTFWIYILSIVFLFGMEVAVAVDTVISAPKRKRKKADQRTEGPLKSAHSITRRSKQKAR